MVVGKCPRCGGVDGLEMNGWHRECLKAQVRLRESLPEREVEEVPELEPEPTPIVETGTVVGISLRPQKANQFRKLLTD